MGPVDLNHLRTFVTLYELRSVTATAAQLHVTQPTVSYTLRKLRQRFDDELFRRRRNELVPTPTATILYGPLHDALAQIDATVASTDDFDPTQLTDEIALALTSVGEQTFLPRIMQGIADAAPRMHLRVERLAASEVEQELLRGTVDMAISVSLFDPARLWRTPFRGVEYVAVTSKRHPLPKVSPTMFEGRRFIRVSTRGGHTYPNQVFMEHDLMPHVALTVEEFSSVPAVLEATDLVALLPRHVSEVFAGWFPSLRLFDLPWPGRGTPVSVYTRPESTLSPAGRWFRGLVLDALRPST